MATLVLTAVGTAVGGPLGGAVGALIGQQTDAAIFAPRARHGPRLGELAVQTSSYGTAIPKIFGTMRVAGTVIWSTELKERRASGGGGKGRPKTVEYSYSASFAVALSGRPVAGVRRIWADGKLLRGAAGDFKSETGFRLHTGDEDQAPDPLIASLEGVGATPAFRGIAYAVFEDMELADFGNRIPSLTFELVAEDAPVRVGVIAAGLTGGEVEDGGTPALTGYATGGDSLRGGLAELAGTMDLSLIEANGALRIGRGDEAAVTIGVEALVGPVEVLRKGMDAVPNEVSIAYYEPARDYQTGLQRALLGGGGRSERIALPAVIAAGEAKALAEQRLAMQQAGRVTARLRLAPRLAGLRPGALVRVDGQAGTWRIERWTLEEAGVTLELVRVAAGSLPAPVASAGRVLGAPDLATGATRLMLVDLPLTEGEQGGGPRLIALAAGEGAGWRSAPLSLSLDKGASWTAAGSTAAPAVMGVTANALVAGGSALFDDAGEVEVVLASEGMWLESRDDQALLAGANLAVLGSELIQFGDAEHLGGRRFRLSRLLRGRRGTEGMAHAVGAGFALLEREAAAVMPLPYSAVGTEARVRADGKADGPDGVEARAMVEGAALRPPSPVHLDAVRVGGSIEISWVRRSRAGWDWLSGSDTPLGEEREAYRVTVRDSAGERSFAVSEPRLVIAADDVPAVIEVVQLGDFGASRPARMELN